MGHFFAFLNRLPFNLRVSRGAGAIISIMLGLTVLAHLVPMTALDWFFLSPKTIPGFRITALFTNSFIEVSESPLGYIFVLAIGCFFLQDKVKWAWQSMRNDLIAFGALLIIVPLAISLFFPAIWGLAAAAVLFMWFAPHLESRWGSRKLWTFLAIIAISSNLVGALLLWISPASAGALISQSATPPLGTRPLIHAMLTVWALSLGRGGKLAILNIEPYKLVYVIAALAGLEAIFSGFASGMMSLAAIGVAWMLVRGVYNPKLIIDRIRLFFIERRLEKRRQGFKVVQGGKDGGPKGPTLH